MKSPKQEQVLDILKANDSMTAYEVALAIGSETKATSKHLRLLVETGQIHISEWKKGKFGVPTKCYKFGHGVSVEHTSTRKGQKRAEKPKKEPVENVNEYMSKNKARIISPDYRLSHAEHIRFMNNFTPQPDYAAHWLFNQPAVELQGNKHDLV